MINKIKIVDFQSHKFTEIVPSPGVNIIVGRNNSGKSAIMRALRLLFYNKPEGGDFVHWGAKDAIIEIAYNDHIIKRVKGTHNEYELDGSKFTSFGRQIPEEILSILGVRAISVDRNVYELNLDNPHTAPFFISETDASKGKLFAKLGERVLGDLVLFDTCINTSNADIRKLNNEKALLEEQTIQLEESLQAFIEVENLQGQMTRIRGLIDVAAKLSVQTVSLKEFELQYTIICKSISELEELTNVDIESISVLQEQAKDLLKELAVLTDLQSSITRMQNTAQLIMKLNTIDTIEYSVIESDIEELETNFKELSKLKSLSVDIFSLQRAIASNTSKVNISNMQLNQIMVDYSTLLSQLRTCPLCKRPVEQHDLDLILKELSNGETTIVEQVN